MLQSDNSCVISKVTKSDFHYTIMFLAGKCVRTCCDRGCEPLFWFSDPPQDQFDLLLMSFSFAVSQNELHRESLSGSSAWFIIRTCDRGVSLDPSPGSWVILECPPGGATTTENRASRTQKCGRVKCFHVTETQIDKRRAEGPPGWFYGYSLTDPSTLTNHKHDIYSQTAHSLLRAWIRRRSPEPKTPQIILWEPSGPS